MSDDIEAAVDDFELEEAHRSAPSIAVTQTERIALRLAATKTLSRDEFRRLSHDEGESEIELFRDARVISVNDDTIELRDTIPEEGLDYLVDEEHITRYAAELLKNK